MALGSAVVITADLLATAKRLPSLFTFWNIYLSFVITKQNNPLLFLCMHFFHYFIHSCFLLFSSSLLIGSRFFFKCHSPDEFEGVSTRNENSRKDSFVYTTFTECLLCLLCTNNYSFLENVFAHRK